jgi:amino acid adenylation domain-containing protein
MSLATPDKLVLDAKLDEARRYWVARLAAGVGSSTIVPDAERVRFPGPSRDTVTLSISGAPCREFVRITGGSPFLVFTFLAAVVKLCLYRHTGSEVIAIGTPALAELGRANAVVIVDRLNDAAPFRRLLIELRESLRQAYEHQGYPFSRLVKELGCEEAPHRCPLFDIAVRLDGLHGDLPDLPNDMTIAFAAGEGELTVSIEYRREVLSRDTVERFAGHLLQLVGEAAAAIDRRVGDFQMLSDVEREAMLHGWNDTRADYPQGLGLHELVEQQAARTPDAVAAVFAGRTVTYRVLNEQANRVARALQEKDAGRGEVVGLMLDRSPEMLTGILGILKSGGAYLPLDPHWPDDRISLIAGDSAMRLLLTTAGMTRRVEALAGLSGTAVDIDDPEIAAHSGENLSIRTAPEAAAYVLYTSGTTGKPKGIVVPHKGVVNYVCWAKQQYLAGERLDFPLFSPLTFDLTVTSIFVPLIAGGKIVIYGDDSAGAPAILKVMQDDAVDIIKLTPAHLQLVRDAGVAATRVRKLILGGEDLKTALARSLAGIFRNDVEIFNEYGPTETVVGCMIHKFDPATDRRGSVPIGRAADNVRLYLLDKSFNPVPIGAIGEIFIGGDGVARGYMRQSDLTAEKFVPDPFVAGARMYRTGDLARWRAPQQMEFCGRIDHQVKIRGARIELGEVEAVLSSHPAIRECVADIVRHGKVAGRWQAPTYCAKCGLPSNYPGVSFDAAGVCNTCIEFDAYRDRALSYFRTMPELRELFERAKAESAGDYDCLMLYSGGKDSTYALHQVVGMGLRVLAFTLDNGYISERAKENIRKVVDTLHVDHVFGTTPFMRDIFAESLRKNNNVCNGCFKTIYTLAMNIAHRKNIKYIVTGLSRGQLFETRLAELFQNNVFDPAVIDRMVIDARKLYHRTEDVISRSLDTAIFSDDATFEIIKFVDFYRYCDVEVDEIYRFLREKASWIRPEDTGRSTNCLINEVGIYVHKKNLGFHNYALPYCWDVRLGHKIRAAALKELDETIDANGVNSILTEIGYEWDDGADGGSETALVGYYVSDRRLALEDVKRFLGQKLPGFMIPNYLVRLDAMPLTVNGKVDRKALPRPKGKRPDLRHDFTAPTTPVEAELAAIWANLLALERVGIHDNFFDLGGHSLLAARVMIRIHAAFQVDLAVRRLFEVPTVAGLAAAIAAEAARDPSAQGPALVRASRDLHRRQRSSLDGSAASPAG